MIETSLVAAEMEERPHHQFWHPRLPHSIDTPATSLSFNLDTSAARYPDKPALIFFDTVMTYRQLKDQVDRLAGWLHAKGVKKGDRVILFMQNCPQFIVAYYAIMRANAVIVPVNPMNRAEELKHYIIDPDAKVAVAAADLAGELVKANAALPPEQQLDHLLVSHYGDAMGASAEVPPAWQEWLSTRHEKPSLAGSGAVHDWSDAMASTMAPPPHELGPDDLCVLPYTSGTTGLPKGCMHTHSTIMHNAVAISMWAGGTSSGTTALLVVPMFHITGMVGGMHTGIYAGWTLVLMPRWDRELAGRLISTWKVNAWTNIPTMIIDLMASPNFSQYDLSSLKTIGGGGAAMPQAVAQKLKDQFGLSYAEGYGLTETAAPSHNNPVDRPKQQCLGIPFMGVDARVVDPDTLEELPVGESGEIIIHGPSVFKGYWKRPDATEASFIQFKGKTFFRSGDMGRVDEEGYFFITDRLKRMINASGFKVWPAEVETLMFRHPAIAEACVISIKDSYRGESVKAVVVLRQDQRGKVTEQEIIDWCRENMAVYKVPRVVEFAETLPKSGSGKVMWRLLQEKEESQAKA